MRTGTVARVREEDCIGCTKCIQVCPTSAIVGGLHFTHTVIPELCTGCDLCLPPCPTDCIDLIDAGSFLPARSRQQFEQREQRRIASENSPLALRKSGQQQKTQWQKPAIAPLHRLRLEKTKAALQRAEAQNHPATETLRLALQQLQQQTEATPPLTAAATAEARNQPTKPLLIAVADAAADENRSKNADRHPPAPDRLR